ncbi:MAG: CDP-diacylglycerol--glycerol-3-phosphate 3-phosphatidyltransferase [Clostridia bacterium]|nr:CDP-diacylglycerol--glycerol-3-phosphate 3-phosphatidyltransferase [Clostridia bacterium]
MNLPNKLTMLRILLIPVYIWAFLTDRFMIAMAVFIIASVTDTFDGMIARKYNLVTNFGKIMDPLADKILVYTAFVLMVPNPVKGWMMVVILAREFTVSGIRTIAAANGIVIAAGMSGKLKTVFQMFAVPFILVSLAYPEATVIGTIAMILLYCSLVLTVYSGAEYVIKNREVFKG